ncbi:hypothetical protein ACFL3E_02335 [Patescibacteria group bacterium]
MSKIYDELKRAEAGLERSRLARSAHNESNSSDHDNSSDSANGNAEDDSWKTILKSLPFWARIIISIAGIAILLIPIFILWRAIGNFSLWSVLFIAVLIGSVGSFRDRDYRERCGLFIAVAAAFFLVETHPQYSVSRYWWPFYPAFTLIFIGCGYVGAFILGHAVSWQQNPARKMGRWIAYTLLVAVIYMLGTGEIKPSTGMERTKADILYVQQQRELKPVMKDLEDLKRISDKRNLDPDELKSLEDLENYAQHIIWDKKYSLKKAEDLTPSFSLSRLSPWNWFKGDPEPHKTLQERVEEFNQTVWDARKGAWTDMSFTLRPGKQSPWFDIRKGKPCSSRSHITMKYAEVKPHTGKSKAILRFADPNRPHVVKFLHEKYMIKASWVAIQAPQQEEISVAEIKYWVRVCS